MSAGSATVVSVRPPEQASGRVLERRHEAGERAQGEVEAQRREHDEHEVDERARHEQRLNRPEDGRVVDDDQRGQARLDERVPVPARRRRPRAARAASARWRRGRGTRSRPRRTGRARRATRSNLPCSSVGHGVRVRAADREERQHRDRGQDGEQRRAEPLGGQDLARQAPLEGLPRFPRLESCERVRQEAGRRSAAGAADATDGAVRGSLVAALSSGAADGSSVMDL